MKAKMSADGYLTIAPDTEVEAYALSRWAPENVPQESKLIIDLSDFEPTFLAQKNELNASEIAALRRCAL
jgi:hypothetical protein